MNHIFKGDYKRRNRYNKSFNNIIEHFSDSEDCDGVEELTDAEAEQMLIYKSGSSSIFDSYYTTTTLRIGASTSTISNIAHFVGSFTDTDWATLLKKVSCSSNVSDQVKTAYNTIDSSRTLQKSSANSDFVKYNNAMKDAISTYMNTQNDTWRSIYDSSDTDFSVKLNNFMVEQAALKEGQKFKVPYEESKSTYDVATNNYYNNLRIDARSKYIDSVQSKLIAKEKEKDRMVSSDIMTKEREVQLNRVSFLKKKRKGQYYRISITFLGLAIIVIAIGQMVPDSNKIIVGSVAGAFLLLGLIIVIGKLIRDSKRYKLDYDEVNYAPYESTNTDSKKSCS